MKRTPLKLMAYTCALALGVMSANNVNAQETITLGATLTTSSAITLSNVTDMDFGTWFTFVGPDTDTAGNVAVVLTLDPSTGAVANTVSDPDGTTDDTALSGSTEITASANVGEIGINTPASAAVDVFADITDFANPNVSLTAITYQFDTTFTSTTGSLNPTSGAATALTTSGGTDVDSLLLGGTVTISDTLADGTFSDAIITVTVQY